MIVSGVNERCRGREGVALVLSKRLWGRVIKYECVNARIVWVKVKVAGEVVIFVCVYGAGMERTDDERESFWRGLNDCLAEFRDDERCMIL